MRANPQVRSTRVFPCFGRFGQSVLGLEKDVSRNQLGAFIRLADHLPGERRHVQSGVHTTTASTRKAMMSVILVFSRRCMVARASLRRSLRGLVLFQFIVQSFQTDPNSSAARVLLFVEASVCRMSSRSTASTVVPTESAEK